MPSFAHMPPNQAFRFVLEDGSALYQCPDGQWCTKFGNRSCLDRVAAGELRPEEKCDYCSGRRLGPRLPANRIVFERADAKFDVQRFDADGRRLTVRDALDWKTACEIARNTLESGGSVFYCHHGAPLDLRPLKNPPAPLRQPGA